MIMKKRLKITVAIAAVVLAALAISVVLIDRAVVSCARDRVIGIDEIAELSDVDCILVLGCGLRDDGSPSAMLADRIDTAVMIYDQTDVKAILASGDHSREDYDEVGAILKRAVESGVPGDSIVLDHAGFSTYESMYRAKNIYGVEKVIIVTQEYHLFRAIYIASSLGIEAYGVSADLRPYGGQWYRDAREVLARVKDFFAVKAQPTPSYDGDGLPY